MGNDEQNDPLRDSDRQEVFVLLFSQERRRIFAFVFSLVPVAADADDIFQQVSLVLWRRFSEFDETQSFYNWACGIAYNTVRNFRRDKGRSRLLFSDKLLEILAAERRELFEVDADRREALGHCIALLKEKDRLLLSQVYELGSSVKDAAVRLGLNTQTTYNRLSLIRKRLLDCVKRKIPLLTQEGI